MEILIKTLQFLLAISILVIFHEFGHFIAARIFKTRVEKFYLFFNPWFSLFKFKRGDTEYGVGWLPLGGYVKISGMIDESMDKEQMKLPAQPYEFRSKPAWQRLIIMLAGVIVNLLLAVVIYIGMLSVWGYDYLPTNEVTYGITVDSLGYEMGLRNGDKIVSVDHIVVEDFMDIPKTIILEEATTIQVIRNDEPFEVLIPEGSISKLIKHKSPDFISVRIPFIVGAFTNDSKGKQAGLLIDDQVIGLNDSMMTFFDQFRDEVQLHKNEMVQVMVLRNNDTVVIPMEVPEGGLLGVYPKPPVEFFTFREKNYNVITAIPAGIVKAYEGTGNYLKSIKLLFSQDKAYESVGGFIAIGSFFPAIWDWQAFWSMTAFLSIMLAVLNILPIPALDGGHVLFLFYEIIFRRKPSDKFLEYAQVVGMVLLFGLLILANANDIIKQFQ
ncbi:MAG: RIP metalloprotease RseP [Bacteroidales bacterium]|nr:RIP metalloprotease RseP [Bacteroidales bacterium]